jgi:hypothetical protein
VSRVDRRCRHGATDELGPADEENPHSSIQPPMRCRSQRRRGQAARR